MKYSSLRKKMCVNRQKGCDGQINDHEPALVILFDNFEGNASTPLQENLIRPYGFTWSYFRD